jgi:hypothetical protein
MKGVVTCTLQWVGRQEFKAKEEEVEKSVHVFTGTGRSSHSDYAMGLDVPWFESRQRLEILSFPKLPDHPASYSVGTEVLCRKVKRPGREANSSHPSSAETKNDWSYTCIPPICLPGVDTENYCTGRSCSHCWIYGIIVQPLHVLIFTHNRRPVEIFNCLFH